MACCLSGAKPLPKPSMAYFKLKTWEKISAKFEYKKNAFENVVCEIAAILS